MPRAGFEPATPATKRPQTYALDHAATGIGSFGSSICEIVGSHVLTCVSTNVVLNLKSHVGVWSMVIISPNQKKEGRPTWKIKQTLKLNARKVSPVSINNVNRLFTT
jgi:hypothetical protein